MSRIVPRHPCLKTLEPYQPPDLAAAAERAGVAMDDLIRLVANENPFGPSPHVAEALGDFDAYHLHPDYAPLKEAVARYAAAGPGSVRSGGAWLTSEWVVLSNGADEMIDLLIRLLVEPGEAIVTCPPTFSMYQFYARVNRCRVLKVPCNDDLALDVTAIERQVATDSARASFERPNGGARVLFVVSPGNPSGQAIPIEVTARLLELPLMVVVDEAYIEFGGESAIDLLPDHDNLVVLRTFSKWAGLAGLRLGYALLAPRLAHDLERIRSPYNVNAAAMVAALTTFDDLDSVLANVSRLIEERERLGKALDLIPWLEPLPSDANFILCRVIGRSARRLVDGLVEEGILIRGFSDPTLASHVRITVGRPEQNDALVAALRAM